MRERLPENKPTNRRKFLGLAAAGTITVAAAGAGVVAALRELLSRKQPEPVEVKVTPESLAQEILSEANIEKAKKGQGIGGKQEMPSSDIPEFIRRLELAVNAGLQRSTASEQLVFIAWGEPPNGSFSVEWRLRRKDIRSQPDRGPVRL